jgi:hypothetical protein
MTIFDMRGSSVPILTISEDAEEANHLCELVGAANREARERILLIISVGQRRRESLFSAARPLAHRNIENLLPEHSSWLWLAVAVRSPGQASNQKMGR